MTDKEKLEKAVKLADGMYYAAQYLTTDASRLHRAMDAYHQFIITEYNKQEPASDDLERCVVEQMEADGDVDDFVRRGIDDIASKYAQLGAQWQKEQIMKDAIEGEVIDKGDFIKFADGKYIDLNPSMGAEPFVKLEDGNKVKVIIIKE